MINKIFISLLLMVIASQIQAESFDRLINADFCSVAESNVALLYQKSSGFLCSGSLIAPGIILTAKHCLKGSPSKYDVYLYGEKYQGVDFARYPNADIGVIKISRPIRKGKYKIAKKLYLAPGQPVLALGFGNPNIGYLSCGYLTVEEYLNPKTFLAANTTTATATCPGDSGGPALVSTFQGIFVAGIVSGGRFAGCLPGNTTYYINPNTPKIFSWIKDAIEFLKD